jgi:NhaA family Na+:H+ antiporter
VALAVVFGFHLPPRMTWRDVLVSGSTAGIGFTVALFFAVAAFPDGRTLDEAKLGALLSVGSAGLAYFGARLLRSGRFRVSPAGRPGR